MTPWEQKNQLVDEVVALARNDDAVEDKEDFSRFTEVFYQTAAPDDVIARPAGDLLAKARFIWREARQHKPGTPIIQVFNSKAKSHGWQTGHTSILIINDDMPFIVDSITGLLAAKRRMQVYCLHHPIMVVERDDDGARIRTVGPVDLGDTGKKPQGRESYLYIEVESTTDKKEVQELKAEIAGVLADVRATVEDWKPMLAKIDETVASLTVNPPPLEEEDVQETIRFLRWLSNNRFTFIGFREYRFDGDAQTSEFRTAEDSGFGILRDPNRHILRGAEGLTSISPEIRHFLTLPDQPVIITKANVKSTVHRAIHLDYIGVKIYDRKHNVVGERRFVGLFTSAAYAESALETPLLRQKVRGVQKRSRFDDRSHAGKALVHIIETFPRDELFQISAERLLNTALGVLHLMERPKPFAFIRRDKFERFVSVLVYVPRENYQSGLRVKVADILCEAFNGEVSVYYAQLSEDVLARWHFIIRTLPGDVPAFDEADINARIAEAAADWSLGLKDQLIAHKGEEQGLRLFRKYEGAFPVAYREDFLPRHALLDVIRLDELPSVGPVDFDAYRRKDDPDYSIRLKLYTQQDLVPLSKVLPLLENLGFSVISENAYELRAGRTECIHDFYLERGDRRPFDLEGEEDRLVDLLLQVWAGRFENGAFNGLCVVAEMTWQEINVIRAYARYLRQIGLPFGQRYLARCLSQNSDITRQLFELFETMFDPAGPKGKARDQKAEAIRKDILKNLDGVASLDHDRILRNVLNVITATLRTNFYQDYDAEFEPGIRGSLAFKIRTKDVEEAPRPRPYAEIFVYSPRLEGVHLRGGPVARGGLRWSDREEDFRTEVLGLVKAQQVKNVVIVPVGAKGGFVPKELPPPTDRDAFMAEGVACYKSFINALLSITDNLKDGKVVHPKKTLRRDGDDPYLVVAADKGTATFSDISNGLAEGRGFWLGDAFASGGSKGYDHKKMGITARGAWVSVQRLYREMGKNTQKDPISVIGVGDMSGDVFGNGMLLSKTIRLLAAFNHMHIFIDPDPDAAASWKERKRLFDLPRSSWSDYDSKLISQGGGVFDRSAKSIKLTPQIKKLFAIQEDALAPHQLINRILKAEADLLWFGGIGTYVKASRESHVDVGDRANDGLRVDADELRVRMVGEGGNLGMSQKARIEFARHNGRLNTDFIDNAGGVNSSDKEVNIKILLGDAIASGTLPAKEREPLLADMTEEVAQIVLRDNYLQVQAISHAEAVAHKQREAHAGLIRTLEREGLLDREIENLPTDEQFSEMALNQQGLTRPEISTLMSYAKMSLKAILAQSEVMDDDYLAPELRYSFPKRLGERFGKELAGHRLRRELAATTLANMLVNRGGLTFVYDVREETGLGIDQIASAFIIARDVFDLDSVWQEIDALDYKVPAAIQTLMHLAVADFLKRQAIWFLRTAPRPLQMADLVAKYRKDVCFLLEDPKLVLSPTTMEEFDRRIDMLTEQKVPKKIASRVAALEVLHMACDIVEVSRGLHLTVDGVGKAFYEVGHRIGFDWLNQTGNMLVADDHWEVLAARAIFDDLADQQRGLTHRILADAQTKDTCSAVFSWVDSQDMTMMRVDRLLSDLKSSGPLSVAKLSFAARHIRSILSRVE